MTESRRDWHVGEISWHPYQLNDALVLRPTGELDATTYRGFRNDLVKFAMDQPSGLIVVVDDLAIASRGSLTAFSSAWMRIGDWPAVPIMLVAGDPGLRATLAGSPLARYVPVHDSVGVALAGLGEPPPRRRSEIELFPIAASSPVARRFVDRTCHHWGIPDRAPDAMQVATELVENSIIHVGTDLRLRMELHLRGLTVAVRDGSPRDAVLRECGPHPAVGLRLVAHLATVWGSAPDMSGGKFVWAVLTA
ncbi:MAG TPA: ATP-binding protein [Pseudonocardiaceae bacterium]|nr:ATP-binding protein [Pseudonocardiaceae bacterium]